MAEWSIDFDTLAKKIGADVDAVVRTVTLEVFSRVIQRSPVDTGRFRANWFPSYNTINVRTTESTDESGSATEQRSKAAVLSFPVGGIVYLTNSLPYAMVIEYGGYPNPPKMGSKKRGEDGIAVHVVNGFSMQAPQGVVRVSAAEVNSIIRQKVSSL